ncbi:MAG: NYN domain-containing protein [Bdellovibrionales bacterium]|nr:NYN domain-containing protein [Bdellovibrionales bacterium]
MAKRSIIYVDGFNFYYGCVRGTSHKWLNLERLFAALRTDDDIQKIYYFTARVSPPQLQRQEVYLSALDTLPLVEVIEGRYKLSTVTCAVSGCGHSGPRTFKKPEEKRTDVNIALHMLRDAYEDNCDRFIIVSGDSDLVPAIDMIKLKFPAKQVIVYVPARHPARKRSTEIRHAADKHRDFPLGLLPKCQFPVEVSDGGRRPLRKPPGW